jgi:phage replication O-like protein O
MSLIIEFKGFTLPTYTQVPDDLFDFLLPTLNEAELKVLLYIIRRTLGFKKHQDQISLSQIEKGTKHDRGVGLSKRTIIRALQSLEKRNCIFIHREKDDQGINLINMYSLKLVNGTQKYYTTDGGVTHDTTPLSDTGDTTKSGGSDISGMRGSVTSVTQQQKEYIQQKAVEPPAASFEKGKEGKIPQDMLEHIAKACAVLSDINGFDPFLYVKAHIKAGIPPEVTLYVLNEFIKYKDSVKEFWAYGQTVLKRQYAKHNYQQELAKHYELKNQHATLKRIFKKER